MGAAASRVLVPLFPQDLATSHPTHVAAAVIVVNVVLVVFLRGV
jgi:hypothetical protein